MNTTESLTPFDLVYQQLLQDVQNNSLVQSYVKEKNLIRFTGNNPQEKLAVQTADLPEVVLWMQSVRGNLHASSSHVMLTTGWTFINSIGSYDSALNNALILGILAATMKWQSTLALLQWNNRIFVRDVRLQNSESGLSNVKANRNISGWASIMNFEVDMSLLITDLAGV